MLKFTTTAAAVFLIGGAAHAAVIDFEDFAHGEAVSSVSIGGINATVTVDSNGSFDGAVAFDTGLTGTADPDLEAPFSGGGPVAPGKVLIISEDGGPDDERFGGSITFAFDQLVSILSFDAFDGARYELSATTGDAFITDDDNVVTGDNLSNTFLVPGFDAVQNLTFSFFDAGEGASGAIDNLTFEMADGGPAPIPVPAALPLLAAGLGGLAFVARRRRS